jgi:plastocyanin
MHAAVLQLAPILGAEKSKVPFYIAGGLLVAWALTVSMLIGMRRPDFPGTKAAERAVIAVTAVLVVAAASTAVITSGGSEATASSAAATVSSGQSPTATTPANGTSTPAATTPANGGTSVPAASTPKPPPKATTGTPAPPSSPASKAATTTLQLAANPEGQLSYNTKQLSAKPGPVTITMANMSPVEHNVTIAQGSKVLGATLTFQGGSRSLSLRLKPGTYTFYCSVPGHRQAGMEGTLTVSS